MEIDCLKKILQTVIRLQAPINMENAMSQGQGQDMSISIIFIGSNM